MTQVYVNDETRALLIIMKFRAIGLLHGELMHNSATMKEYSELLHQPGEEDEFTLHVGQFALRKIKDRLSLGGTLATRLCPEFASIFWAQLSDHIIDKQTCDYKNFGIFRSSRATGQLRVSFDPSNVLANGELPDRMRSNVEVEQHVDDYCRAVMDLEAPRVAEWPDFGTFHEWRFPLMFTSLLVSSLDEIFRRVATSAEIIGLLEKPRFSDKNHDWLSVFALAAAYSSYYAWANAFGMTLHTGSAIEVDGIGRFYEAHLKIQFEAHAKFQTLLDANIPMTKSIAA